MPKQRRIALKIYEWVDKGLYFHKMTRKKNSKKIVLSTLEPRTANLCFIANGLFSHSGSHITSNLKDISNYSGIISNYFSTSNYSVHPKCIE